MDPVDRIVAVHDGTHVGFLDSLPERREIDFMHSPDVNVGRCMVATPLLVIGSEMFHRGNHALVLHTYNIVLCDFRSQIRVFSEIFEIPAAHRAAVHVHSGAKKDCHSPGLGIGSKRMAELFGEFPVPCRC